ncbi:HIT-type domain-containing protein [Entamoeba marina]
MNQNHLCVVCNQTESKYKCPRCNQEYCSLICWKQHKLVCKEKKTEFIAVSDMTDETLGEDLALVSKVQNFMNNLKVRRQHDRNIHLQAKRKHKKEQKMSKNQISKKPEHSAKGESPKPSQ